MLGEGKSIQPSMWLVEAWQPDPSWLPPRVCVSQNLETGDKYHSHLLPMGCRLPTQYLFITRHSACISHISDVQWPLNVFPARHCCWRLQPSRQGVPSSRAGLDNFVPHWGTQACQLVLECGKSQLDNSICWGPHITSIDTQNMKGKWCGHKKWRQADKSGLAKTCLYSKKHSFQENKNPPVELVLGHIMLSYRCSARVSFGH